MLFVVRICVSVDCHDWNFSNGPTCGLHAEWHDISLELYFPLQGFRALEPLTLFYDRFICPWDFRHGAPQVCPS